MKANRKEFIKTGAILAAGVLLHHDALHAAAGKMMELTNEADLYALPQLGYEYNALEPYIDKVTMQIHHQRHHQAYINKLKETVSAHHIRVQTLEELITDIDKWPAESRTTIRNNGGGHWNHSFFWKLLKQGTSPGPKAKTMIQEHFGTMDNFKTQFEKAAAGQFGSGWAWVVKVDGKLKITSTPNQDNPLMKGAAVQGQPVIALDVWEHAYYLHYQNKRADYIQAFWNVLNWERVEQLLNA